MPLQIRQVKEEDAPKPSSTGKVNALKAEKTKVAAAKVSEPIFATRGGLTLWNGRVTVFGRGVYAPYFSTTPPLAKLSCFSEQVTITVGAVSLTIATNDIEEVRFRQHGLLKLLLLGQDTLTIRHHGKGPNPVFFSSWSDLARVVDGLEGIGVKVVRN